jgi:hypothetical protein
MTLFALALMVRTWTTLAISARFSAKPLPEELLCSSTQAADLARPPRLGGLKRNLSQWSRPAKLCSHSSRSLSATRRGSTPQGIPQFGLVAEEVEEVNPDLVVRDKEGKVNTVRYDAVNAMLLNESLKEHRKNEQQEVTIARQQEQIEALAEGLQKVSAQLEINKSAPHMVNNDP